MAKKKWSPKTKLSYVMTLLSQFTRHGISLVGDKKGMIRLFKLEALKHAPTRVNPIPLQQLIGRLRQTKEMDIEAMITLMWAYAARLTSIHQIRQTNMEFKQMDSRTTAVCTTFRAGKTILATGAYSITARIPTRIANWLLAQPATVFPQTVGYYYDKVRRILRPYTIRSIRRGAVQHLAKEFDNEQIRLITRHTKAAGLYAYLDDGRHETHEQETSLQMSSRLWTST